MQYICGNHHTDRIISCQSGSIFTISNLPENLIIILICIDIQKVNSCLLPVYGLLWSHISCGDIL